MPVNTRPNPLTKVEQDYRLFTWFLTLVVIVMYTLALTANSSLRQPLPFLLITTLVVIHIYLHWRLCDVHYKMNADDRNGWQQT